MRPEPGDVVGGKYRIVRLIGDGGMGTVYEAEHELLGTNVALKFLHADLAKRPGLSSRFLQEARVSARIQSPHVTRVTDVDQTPQGSPFIVMELLHGESLQNLLDRRSKLPQDQAIDFALQMLAGLEAAHALGVVHRDLKPDNVFITPSTGGPVLKLLDFGIAKLFDDSAYQKKGLTRPGAVMGTPEYMAPEQLYSADKVDHRADIYSLGVILYEMLSGERPAYGDDAASIVAQVAQGKIKHLSDHTPTVSGALGGVVHRAMAPLKEQRYESALEMRLALAGLAGDLSVAGRLAATPAPAGVSSAPPAPPTKQSRTEDLGPLAAATSADPPRKSAVPKTLPPEDEAPPAAPAVTGPRTPDMQEPPQGSTQEASKELIAELARHTAEQHAVPMAPRTAAPTAGHAAAPAPYPAAYAPTPARRGGGGSGALLALLAGLLVTGGVIALVVFLRSNKGDGPEVVPLGDPPPETTITAQGTSTPQPNPNPQNPLPTPTPTTKPTGTQKPLPKKDGGADASSAEGGAFPFPIPTTLPTALPSQLPPMPTFPFPTWPPQQPNE